MVSGSAFTTLPSMGITESIKPPTSVALAEKFIKYQNSQKNIFKKTGGTITAYGRSGSSYDDNGAAISWWVVH